MHGEAVGCTQDRSADYVLRLALAPSYVTYNKKAIEEVADFFKSDRPMELSRLQAQAAARSDAAGGLLFSRAEVEALNEIAAEAGVARFDLDALPTA